MYADDERTGDYVGPLSQLDQGIVDKVVAAAEAGAGVVNFDYTATVDEVRQATEHIKATRGDLLLEQTVIWGFDGRVHHVELVYLVPASELDEERKRFEDRVEEALSWTDPSMSAAETAKAIHDFLVRNVSYDFKSYVEGEIPPLSATAYGALEKGKAVCGGYSRAFSTLLRRCGIESAIRGSSTMNHEWNLVKIGVNWYNVDVTWDDPVSFATGQDGGFYDEVNHNNFLLSDAAIAEEGHYGWEDGIACLDTRFDDADWPAFDRPCSLADFSDVDAGAWYVGSLAWSVSEGLFGGFGDGRIGPQSALTRGQAATVLFRAFEDDLTGSGTARFKDVPDGAWYATSINWASSNGVMNGSDNTFRPEDAITREEFVVTLMNVRKALNPKTIFPTYLGVLKFPDSSEISGWAMNSVSNAMRDGIIGNNGTIEPQRTVTRAEASAMLENSVSAGWFDI